MNAQLIILVFILIGLIKVLDFQIESDRQEKGWYKEDEKEAY